MERSTAWRISETVLKRMPRSGSFILGIKSKSAPFELSTQQALLKVSYDFQIAGNGLYTMLVTTMKDS